ncbi:unnamed protein product, partial [Prunus brigantina]
LFNHSPSLSLSSRLPLSLFFFLSLSSCYSCHHRSFFFFSIGSLPWLPRERSACTSSCCAKVEVALTL